MINRNHKSIRVLIYIIFYFFKYPLRTLRMKNFIIIFQIIKCATNKQALHSLAPRQSMCSLVLLDTERKKQRNGISSIIHATKIIIN